LAAERPKASVSARRGFLEFVGISPEFTLSDRILAFALVIWNFGWFVTFLVFTAIHFTFGTSTEWWTRFWHFYLLMQFCISVPVVIWFTVGGILDMKALFHTLRNLVRDQADDGTVRHESDDRIELATAGKSLAISIADAPELPRQEEELDTEAIAPEEAKS
jgi:hypothetical protein